MSHAIDNVISIIETSFLKDLLSDESITDISYNGQNLYFFSSKSGRAFYKSIDNSQVLTFLRNIANYANVRFSYSDTFLDISVGKYRLSAMHYALSRFGYKESLSFALRINHNFLARNPHYLGEKLGAILQDIMSKKRSIIISGTTGVGKTTLQKYLLMLLPPNTRVLVIDNVLELGEVHTLNETLDITLWQTKDNKEEAIREYVQRALRFHPDYLIIAESRGHEMKEILQGAISGHPNIVTLHADSAEIAYDRVLYLSGSPNKDALYHAYPYVIHLAKKEDNKGQVKRYIERITAYDVKTKKIKVIYCEDKE
ncbi:MAG: ATPase, T2SS/T4P/T4SS family [Bacilli bacterium]